MGDLINRAAAKMHQKAYLINQYVDKKREL